MGKRGFGPRDKKS